MNAVPARSAGSRDDSPSPGAVAPPDAAPRTPAPPGRPAAPGWTRWLRGGPVLALAALVVGFALLQPQFLSVANGLNILREAAILGVIALAGTLVIVMGSIDLSVAASTAFIAVCTAMLADGYGPAAGLLAPLVLGAGCGLLNGLLVGYLRLPSFIITLGTLFVFTGSAEFLSEGTPVTVADSPLGDVFGGTLPGTPIPNNVLWALGAAILLTTVAHRTRLGRHIYGVGGGETVMTLSGIDVRRVKLAAFVIAGLLAGLAALLLIHRVGSAQSSMGDTYLLPAIAAVVLGGTALTGGTGGPQYTVLGVLILAVLGNGMTITGIDPFLQTVIQGLVVIVAVVLTFDRSKVAVVK